MTGPRDLAVEEDNTQFNDLGVQTWRSHKCRRGRQLLRFTGAYGCICVVVWQTNVTFSINKQCDPAVVDDNCGYRSAV